MNYFINMYRLSLLVTLLAIVVHVYPQETTSNNWIYKIMPNNVKLQYAGNIGMFAAGVGYVSPNQKWKGDFFYGIVPGTYAEKPINSITLKGKYAPIYRQYKRDITVNWLNTGLWFNYSFGDEYFLGLPHYYDTGYYYFPTALNMGAFAGSEIRYRKWGFYYEFGTTEKHLINYVKNVGSINFRQIWNIGLGLVYHLK